jgi:hypothetical protein
MQKMFHLPQRCSECFMEQVLYADQGKAISTMGKRAIFCLKINPTIFRPVLFPPKELIGFNLDSLTCDSIVLYHNLGLGTKYILLHVGWIQNLNLFLVVFILVSTRATWDFGIKILV